MFKIGEFSKLMQVSVRMLRHYDEAGLLKPAKTDPVTGYRYYSAEQIPRLRRVLFLRDTGFGVAEMGPVLDSWNASAVARLLEEKKRAIIAEIAALESRVAKIDMGLRDLAEDALDLHADVAIKSVPGYPVLSLRRVIPDYYAEGRLWKELSAFAEANAIPVSGETFSIYHDSDYRERDVDVELCAIVTELGQNQDGFTFRRTEPVEIMASGMVRGPFENIAGAFLALAGWLTRHEQYEMEGTSRQIVHRGPWNEPDPAGYLTEMQIPLRRR